MAEILILLLCSVLSAYMHCYIHNEDWKKNNTRIVFWICCYFLIDISVVMLADSLFCLPFYYAAQQIGKKRILFNLALEGALVVFVPVIVKKFPVWGKYVYLKISVHEEGVGYQKNILDKGKVFYLFVILEAVLCFILLYGFMPLNVMDDRWILTGYVEGDIQSHYAGWLAARNTGWTFPLGYANTLGYPDGVIISFTDSIPIAVLFFKIFRAVLPETFQFFGLFIMLCFILQGIACVKVMNLFVGDRRVLLVAELLFVFMPVMLERAFKHCALSAHFLIIFSLYLYFRSKKKGCGLSKWYWMLGVLAIGIHPYFLPMVLGIYAADAAGVARSKKMMNRTVLHMAAGLVLMGLFGFLIGTFGYSTGEGVGYGQASLNLNGIFNPLSKGDISWSAFLPKLPYSQTMWPWDGFAYLGGGLLLACCIFLMEAGLKGVYVLYAYIRKLRNGEGMGWKAEFKYADLVIVLAVFLFFAITNEVYFGEERVLHYSIPNIALLKKICNVFRSSGRMLWPAIYVLTVGLICWLSKKTKSMFLVIFLAVCQLVDLSPALAVKHGSFKERRVEEGYSDTIFASDAWDYLGRNIDYLWDMDNSGGKIIPLFTQKYKIITNAESVSRTVDIAKEAADYTLDLYKGKLAGDNTAYLFSAKSTDGAAYASWVMNKEMHVYELDDYYIIWSGSIPDKETVAFQKDGYQLNVINLTDDNWSEGVLNNSGGTVYLMPNSECYGYLLGHSRGLRGSDGNYYKIVDAAVSGDSKSLLLQVEGAAESVIYYFECDLAE